MKYTIYVAWLILLVVATVPATAQEECATEVTQVQIDYMNDTRSAREDLDVIELRNEVTIIPLVAHIIRQSNGTGGLSLADLDIAMNDLNTAFAQANFEFELCDINYIDNSAYGTISYSTSAGSEEFQMATANRIPGKVNIFFVDNPRAGSNAACGWSSFPSYKAAFDKDWTIMKNSCAINGSTFPHELGHWLNLYHTHQGVSGGLGVIAKELVDGSNCGPNVGDELCDTPADPRLSGCVSAFPGCSYTCSSVDANGDFYTPDTSNMMSYSQKRCRTFFSDQQITRMQQSYLFDRNDLTLECDGALACQITAISVSNASACNDNGTPENPDDDFFTANVSVLYVGQPTSGTLDISVTDGASAGTAQFSNGSHTFNNVTMPANGQAVSITASFSADAACTFTNSNAHAGMSSCVQTIPCQLTYIYLWGISDCDDNGTPNNPTDDFFTAVVRVYNQNPPTSGNLVVTGDANVSVPVSQLSNTTYHNFYNVSLPADGTPVALTAYFSAETSCSYASSNLYEGKQPCSSGGSSDCDVNATITQTITGSFFKEVLTAITANNDIQSGATAVYDAGYEITLTDGFDAAYGSDFDAYIDGCDANDTDIEDELMVNDLDATLGHLRNFPNPFDQYTTIEFLLNKEALVTIEIYGINGQFIGCPLKNERHMQGTHQFNLDASQLAPGTYLCRVRTDNELKVMKMTVMR